ncbi:hypothetical protein Hthe01_09020 [Hydrogenophilus thermoluteolus]|uniref:5-oxoprolinase subunit B family protein n=1 Tax=Hydrogenophilus thermoluteolus TaxID=297 RepID=UPI0024A0F210|nr:carboxyltransferase domain-containing protein [Hydrogenophilus thermoluteolus]GLW60553.1 hypothetical protein Hthe01_09020 [Hydrogenophilus thermoluteolus]
MTVTPQRLSETQWRIPLDQIDRHSAAQLADALVTELIACGYPAAEAVVGFDAIALWGCPDEAVLSAALSAIGAEESCARLPAAAPDSDPSTPSPHSRTHELPLIVTPETAPDLVTVAEALGRTPEAVLDTFLACTFTVAAVGFLPGFPFLEGLPETLVLPRRANPRLKVPAGSVAIAQRMACIYPWESPGGWHLIGRTPVTLFDPTAMPPARLRPGDRVRFVLREESR